MFIRTTKSVQTGLGKSPEALYPVDTGSTLNELIPPIIDTKMHAVYDVNQTILAPPAIAIDDAVQINRAADNALLH